MTTADQFTDKLNTLDDPTDWDVAVAAHQMLDSVDSIGTLDEHTANECSVIIRNDGSGFVFSREYDEDGTDAGFTWTFYESVTLNREGVPISVKYDYGTDGCPTAELDYLAAAITTWAQAGEN